MDHLGEFIGKLHPILLHFPLALLVVEWQMRRRMTAAQPAEVEVHERAA